MRTANFEPSNNRDAGWSGRDCCRAGGSGSADFSAANDHGILSVRCNAGAIKCDGGASDDRNASSIHRSFPAGCNGCSSSNHSANYCGAGDCCVAAECDTRAANL